MAIRLIVLGSGTAVPCLKRSAPGYLIKYGQDTWLIDCGSGTLNRILLAREDPLKLSGIFITHLHPDHCSDLVAILHAMVVPPGRHPAQALHIIGHERLKEYYEKCILSLMKKPPFEVVFNVPERPVTLSAIEVKSFLTGHTPDSLAYRLRFRERTIVFTGDTSFSEGLIEFARGADLLVADSSYTEKTKKGHMSALECGRLARLAGVKALLLSHLYPVAPEEEFKKEAEQEFKGTVLVAGDLMVVDL